ncbi:MAG TPA: hypothetical protein VM123_09385 [archaeon]|nr:hypothetical protein [archaeon]
MRKKFLALVLALGFAAGVFSYLLAQNFMDVKPTMQFAIPRNFGLLVTIYPSGANTVMWFEAQDGTIRRVLLDASGNFDLNVWAITRE